RDAAHGAAHEADRVLLLEGVAIGRARRRAVPQRELGAARSGAATGERRHGHGGAGEARGPGHPMPPVMIAQYGSSEIGVSGGTASRAGGGSGASRVPSGRRKQASGAWGGSWVRLPR